MDFEHGANEEQIKTINERAKDDRRQEIQDYKDILATSAGMRFFKRFFERGHLFCTTFKNNGWSAFLEGERNFALEIFNNVCEAAPDKVGSLIIKSTEDFKNGRS